MCSMLLILGARQFCFYLFASLRAWRPCGKAFASLVLSGPCSLTGTYHDSFKVVQYIYSNTVQICSNMASSNINFKKFLDLVLVVMHKSFIVIHGHIALQLFHTQRASMRGETASSGAWKLRTVGVANPNQPNLIRSQHSATKSQLSEKPKLIDANNIQLHREHRVVHQVLSAMLTMAVYGVLTISRSWSAYWTDPFRRAIAILLQ